MPLSKGQRVEIRVKGTTYPAHVHKVAAAGVTLVLDDWRVTRPIPAAQVTPSLAPVPDGSPGHRKWGKSDRVAFDHEGRVVDATVVSADLVTVKAMADGGEMEYRLSARDLRPSTKVLPVPAPSVMDDWAVKGYKPVAAMSEETEAFAAEITYRGRAVIKASNAGHGGCNMYHGPRDVLDRLHRDAKAWLDEANVEHLSEAADLWVTWHATLRPYAVDAMEHLRAFDRQIGQMIHTPDGP